MKDFISCLFEDNLLEAKEILVDRIEELISEKLESLEVEIVPEVDLDEGNIQRMGRTKLIRVRIRKGKIQRRVKKAAVKGYTIRSGRLVRMTPMEKRHRKMAARRSKFKRRSKLMQSMRKRNISIRKRKGLGLQ
jgi:F0F1-type ATP synthase delta subunit